VQRVRPRRVLRHDRFLRVPRGPVTRSA
jgi:hypothetical protein